MAIKCAHCKGHHDTVTEVRDCSGISDEQYHGPQSPASRGIKFTDDGLQPVTEKPMWPASDAQKNYVLGLQEERQLPVNWVVYDRATLDLLERDEVDGAIKALKELPRKPGANSKREWKMPEGRYAICIDKGDDGVSYSYVDRQDLVPPKKPTWWFFKVDKPTRGKWKGYTFIKRLVGAPGDYREVPMSPSERNKYLEAIEADPDKAMSDYGKQTMVCGRCSSPLTNEESRARGIGPICLGKLGW